MRSSEQQQVDARGTQRAAPCATLAKSLAPEEIRPGDFVTPLYVTAELPSFLWHADAATLPLDDPIRMQFVPPDGGVPMKVKSACLPFVLVKLPTGKQQVLDVRLCRLARLDPGYAAVIWKTQRKKRAKRKQ
jgi:hypothetical protein